MIKRSLAILVGICLLPLAADREAGGIENSCVACHRDLPRDTFIGSKYQDWRSSIHAEEAITCDRCHGGRPSADEKAAAHTGVYNSDNPGSRVYYKNVPGTCGACHRRDFNAFKSSTHYVFLEQTGAGPTCVTCHESHAARMLSPRRIPETCEECHNRRMRISPEVPERAQALLLLINETSLLVGCAREKVPGGDKQKLQNWKDAYTTMETVRDEWHAFDLKRVQIQILKAYQIVKPFLKQGK